MTKALGQRFDVFSFPHPDLLSPEITVALQISCFSVSLRIGFTIYYLLSLMSSALASRFFTTSTTWEIHHSRQVKTLREGIFSLGDLLDPGVEPGSPALQMDS